MCDIYLTIYFFIKYEILNIMNQSINEQLSLPSLKKRHERKSLFTPTLKKINSRLQYYRKILNQPMPTDPKIMLRREKILKKYEHDMKVRRLLNRAAANRYI